MTNEDWDDFYDAAADISWRKKSGSTIERNEQLMLEVAKECFRLGLGKAIFLSRPDTGGNQ